MTLRITKEVLEKLKSNWLDYLSNKPIEEYKPSQNKNAKIPEISNLNAVHALIVSLQDNLTKRQITEKCLKNVYNLSEMPKDKSSSANYCNPDTYTLSYLGILFGDKKNDESKNANWWKKFWDENQNNLVWSDEKGIYELKK
ncbi:MAG TPA: hypothetical protein VFK73_04855 [Paludibacter sp.]|nr:hypothetical protein [Paludibacter sp.]